MPFYLYLNSHTDYYMTERQGLGILEGEGILGQLGENIGNGGGKEGVMGYGMIGKLKNSMQMRLNNTKNTAQDAKGILLGGSWRPFDLITHHIESLRNANQELRPNVVLK